MKRMKVTASLRLYTEGIGDYEPWSGAVDTYNYIVENDMLDTLETILEDLYPEGMTETQLNDLLWFEPETVYDWLGLEDPYAEDDEE